MISFKKPFLKITFPITLIIFSLFTKWWYVHVEDGTDGIMYGFPFIYQAPAFYTSVAQEYFLLELFLDIFFYWCMITILLLSINKFLYCIKTNKITTYFLYMSTFILVCMHLLLASSPENKFSLYREDNIIIKKTGFKYFFSNKE